MTYVLYTRLGSGGFCIDAALAYAGLPYRLKLIDSKPGTSLPQSFREINPWLQVPVLITQDGLTLTETAAILIYLVENHPESPIGFVKDPGIFGSFLRWTIFIGTNIYEGILRKGYPERYTTDAAGLDGVRSAAQQRNQSAFMLLESLLQENPFLFGNTMSATDIFLAMVYAWHGKRSELPRCTHLTHTVARHAVISPIWHRHFAHRLDYKWNT